MSVFCVYFGHVSKADIKDFLAGAIKKNQFNYLLDKLPTFMKYIIFDCEWRDECIGFTMICVWIFFCSHLLKQLKNKKFSIFNLNNFSSLKKNLVRVFGNQK